MSKKPAVTSKNYLTVPPGDYPCGNNLYLIVAPTGARRWLFVFQRDGIKDKMGFGSANDVTLKEATDKAIDARRLLAKGINPKDQRDDERRAATGCQLFGPYATAWRETYGKSLKHKSSRAKLKNQIDNHCAALHKLRMDEISTDHIIKLVLDPIRGKAETARDIRQRLSLIFKAAIADDLRKDNPADYETRLHPKMGKAPKRGKVRGKHKAMSHHALPAFMAKVAACPDLSARAIEITVLTVARTAEILNMKWSDIDLETTIWTIDTTGIRADDSDGGEGTKNEVDKVTPLSRQAIQFLRQLHQDRVGNYVFAGRDLASPMSNMTMLKKIKELSGDPKLTVHGLRGTFRTWAQDETDFEEEIVEHVMHHITGDAAEKAYKHGQALRKRQIVLQAWADFATTPKRPSLRAVA